MCAKHAAMYAKDAAMCAKDAAMCAKDAAMFAKDAATCNVQGRGYVQGRGDELPYPRRRRSLCGFFYTEPTESQLRVCCRWT